MFCFLGIIRTSETEAVYVLIFSNDSYIAHLRCFYFVITFLVLHIHDSFHLLNYVRWANYCLRNRFCGSNCKRRYTKLQIIVKI